MTLGNVINDAKSLETISSTDNGNNSNVVISPTYVSTSKKLIWSDASFTALMFLLCWAGDVFFNKNTSYILTYISGIFISHIATYSTKSFLEKKKG